MKERLLLLLKEFLTALDDVSKDLHVKERGEKKTKRKERRKREREREEEKKKENKQSKLKNGERAEMRLSQQCSACKCEDLRLSHQKAHNSQAWLQHICTLNDDTNRRVKQTPGCSQAS